MPLLPGGIPGFGITLHINTVRTPCWWVMPFILYMLRLVRGMKVLSECNIAPVGNAGMAIRNMKHNTGR